MERIETTPPPGGGSGNREPAVPDIFLELGVSLGLGLLVGIQREWTDAPFAGIRTFAIITVLGTATTQLAGTFGPWLALAGFIIVGIAMLLAWNEAARVSEPDPGHTTQMAVLAMYVAGASLAVLGLTAGIVLAGVVVALLHWKEPLHGFVDRIGKTEIRAIMQLALIAMVVLPVLPNRTFGPYDVLNPFQIWLMVVLICGISVLGYFAYKFFGARAGTVLSGILGGVISSTATSVSYATRSKQAPEMSGRGAAVILIASSMVFIRVLIEVAMLAPAALGTMFPPLLIMLGVMAVVTAALFVRGRSGQGDLELDEEPSDLKAALWFGAMYGGILLAVAIAEEHFGNAGLYVVAGISGLTDMDAITLSTARLIQTGGLEADAGWRMILVGAISNTVFKGAAIATLGSRRLFVRVGLAFGVAIAAAVLLIIVWPGSA